MTARIVHRTILVLMLASLPCFVTAAGSPGCDNAQAIGTDQASPYDYRTLSEAAFYAPGSYSSWFYVSPPAYETTLPAPEVPTQSSAPVALDFPTYYDYEPRWGPLLA